MTVTIISPTLNEVVQTNSLPQTVRVIAVLPSNVSTDARFTLDGVAIGTDTTATTFNNNGTIEYRYQLNIPVQTAGVHQIKVEDLDPRTNPATVRSSAISAFELKFNAPTISLSQSGQLTVIQ